MIAVSANGELGDAGLLLVLGASIVGTLSTAYAIWSGNRMGLRQASLYASLILAGTAAVILTRGARAARSFWFWRSASAAGARPRRWPR